MNFNSINLENNLKGLFNKANKMTIYLMVNTQFRRKI